MRRPIEALARAISAQALDRPTQTIGDLATKFAESPGRITDALDCLRLLKAMPGALDEAPITYVEVS